VLRNTSAQPNAEHKLQAQVPLLLLLLLLLLQARTYVID
jgi:hypothetical protein